MAKHRYDILAIDLDGTLLNSKGEISQANVRAVHSAREAGMRVIICTGRGLKECLPQLRAIEQTDAVAVAGGSIIADPVTGGTLHRFAIDHAMAGACIDVMHEFELPALVLKDPHATGFDYLVAHGDPVLALDPIMEWWFDRNGVDVRYAQHIHDDEHADHTVRVGAFGVSTNISKVAQRLTPLVDDRGTMHHFPAVVGPEHRARLGPGEEFHILELFSDAGNKWSALSYLLEQSGIDPSRTAAIGDEINDMSMITSAGLGVAMGNGIAQVKAAAKHTTKRHDEDGVAHAIDQILGGVW